MPDQFGNVRCFLPRADAGKLLMIMQQIDLLKESRPMPKRRGRPRKTGERRRNGHLKPIRDDSPRTIAARMPHRRAFGDHALDQDAENVLGRMVLRGEITRDLALAGETYARLWRGYVATLDAPQHGYRGHGRDLACVGCPSPQERKFCLCDFRRRIYLEAFDVLISTGGGVQHLVRLVAIDDVPCPPEALPNLIGGLSALADRFGLTTRHNRGTKITVSNHAGNPSHR